MGDAKTVDFIKVVWLDNSTQNMHNVAANQHLVISHQPEKNTKKSTIKTVSPLFTKVDPIINCKSEKNRSTILNASC